jgi:KDO2-lipid IV(A) lauroyltransferase
MAKRLRLKHVAEYIPVRLFQLLMEILPHRVALYKGSVLGIIAFSILGIRKRVSLENLRLAFPEKDEREIAAIAKRSYQLFGMTVAEICRFRRLGSSVTDKIVELDGVENLEKALSQGKGVIMVTGHFGNWELYGCLSQLGYPVTFMVGEQHNLLVDRLINSLREALGTKLSPLTGDLREILKDLKSDRAVGFLSDQNAGKRGIFVDFFGRKASTPFGAARFSMLTGAPVVTGGAVRLPGGKHRLVVDEPIYPSASRGDKEMFRLTQAYTTRLEELVRRYPDHYFWPHRRWKTRPPD